MGGASERDGTTGTGSDGSASDFLSSLLPVEWTDGRTYGCLWGITKKKVGGTTETGKTDLCFSVYDFAASCQTDGLTAAAAAGGKKRRRGHVGGPHLELTDPPTLLHSHIYTHARIHTHVDVT